MLVSAIPVLCFLTWVAASNDPVLDLPRFGKPLNNLTISVGREAVFICIVENLGSYKVAWLRVDTQTILTIANHVITKNHRISVTHSGHRTWSLHIKDTKETDRGYYMCQVNTDPMSSITGFLEIVVPPDILDYPTSTDMVVREGNNVTLRCAATGTPEPVVTWRREEGGKITLSNWKEVATIQGPELEIQRVTRLHMGPYLCIASNGVPPTVSKRIVLIVHFPALVRIENMLIGAYRGQKLELTCISEAFPKPITYWTKPNNETIINDSNFVVETEQSGYEITMRLTILAARQQDFGVYRCCATNSLGETDGEIKLYEIGKPPTTHNPGGRKDFKEPWRINRDFEKETVDVIDGSLLKEDFRNLGSMDSRSATATFVFPESFARLIMVTTAAAVVRTLSS